MIRNRKELEKHPRTKFVNKFVDINKISFCKKLTFQGLFVKKLTFQLTSPSLTVKNGVDGFRMLAVATAIRVHNTNTRNIFVYFATDQSLTVLAQVNRFDLYSFGRIYLSQI